MYISYFYIRGHQRAKHELKNIFLKLTELANSFNVRINFASEISNACQLIKIKVSIAIWGLSTVTVYTKYRENCEQDML